MKKLLFFLLLAILSTTPCWAYDFSAVAPSGQMLYYNIVGRNVTVTHPGRYWPNDIQPIGSLIIPSYVIIRGHYYSVVTIEPYAFWVCGYLTSVSIPNTVTSIGDGAFESCRSLTSVIIPNSVHSIGPAAFAGCTNLSSVTLPNTLTSIEAETFFDCCSLTSISIPNTVTHIGEKAFAGCTGLLGIELLNSVDSIDDNAFLDDVYVHYCGSASGCPWGARHGGCYFRDGDYVYSDSTKSTLIAYIGTASNVAIPSTVTSIGNRAFMKCYRLKSVTIPSTVTSIGDGAFKNCSNLSGVTIPSTVTSIGDSTFYDCSSACVVVPSSVTSIGTRAFYGVKLVNYCGSATGSPWGARRVGCYYRDGDFVYTNSNRDTLLAYVGADSNITIPNTVTTIGDNAFFCCNILTSITIPNTVTAIGDFAFYRCSNLTSITIPNSVTTIGNDAFDDDSTLRHFIVPSSVTSIGIYAFGQIRAVSYCGSATGSPWGARRVGCYYMDGDFVYSDSTRTTLIAYLGKAPHVTIPSTVITIGNGAIDWWKSLVSVTIPNSVRTIDSGAFYGCNNLTSVTIGDSVTSIGVGAFGYCFRLSSVTMGNSVTSIGSYAFGDDRFLDSITIPSSVDSIGPKAFYRLRFVHYCGAASGSPWGAQYVGCLSRDGDFLYSDSARTTLIAYLGCAPHVVIPSTVKVIDKGAFRHNQSLIRVTLPDTLTRIGDSAFYACDYLGSIVIPDSVVAIGNSAFQQCSSVISITLGSALQSIGSYAFDGCGADIVSVPNTVTSIGEDAFQGTNLVCYCGSATGSPWGANYVGCYYMEGDFIYSDSTKTILVAYLGSDANVVIPNTVRVINNKAFFANLTLTSVTIPNQVTSIGDSAFYGCTALADVVWSSSLKTITRYAFSGCWNLSNITLPESLTNIGPYAFRYCKRFTNIVIPDGVDTIEAGAFYDCIYVRKLTIGTHALTIGDMAFRGMGNLDTIISRPSSAPSIDGSVFSSSNHSALVIVPCGSLDAYYQNYAWRTFPNMVEDCGQLGIEDNALSYIVSVYPNPADDYAVVSCEGLDEDVQVTLYDRQGRVINTYRMYPGEDMLRIDTQRLASGIYFVRIAGQHTYASQSIIKR